MKLTLEETTIPNTLMDNGLVAFRIHTQEGCDNIQFKASNGILVSSEGSPAWDDQHKKFNIRGCRKELDSRIIITTRDNFNLIQNAIDEMLKKYNVLEYNPAKFYIAESGIEKFRVCHLGGDMFKLSKYTELFHEIFSFQILTEEYAVKEYDSLWEQ